MKSTNPPKRKLPALPSLEFFLHLIWLIALAPPLFLGAVFPRQSDWLPILLQLPRWKDLWGKEWSYVLKKIQPLLKPTKTKSSRLQLVHLLSRWWWASVRYASGKPYEYAWGEAEFLGNTYRVNQAVLIPRPETEELTALMIADIRSTRRGIKKSAPVRILEIGTGSGVIAISLQLAFPQADITLVDISAEAIQVAQHNCERILKGASPYPRFIIADGFLLLEDPEFFSQFEVIVSNPPYVGMNDKEVGRMSASTIRYEPAVALFAGEDGLVHYRRLAGALRTLQEAGRKPPKMYLEMGDRQGKDIRKIFHGFGVEIKKDLFGKERFVVLG